MNVSTRSHKRKRIRVSRYKRKQHRNRNNSQNGGKKWSLKYKKSINCNRPRGFSQRQHCKYGAKTPSKSKTMRFNQSGGDSLNYLPSDLSMSLRTIGDAFSNVVDSVKGFAPAPSSLPYNDHKLQKTEVAFSERIPDIATYYKNAMNLIPAL